MLIKIGKQTELLYQNSIISVNIQIQVLQSNWKRKKMWISESLFMQYRAHLFSHDCQYKQIPANTALNQIPLSDQPQKMLFPLAVKSPKTFVMSQHDKQTRHCLCPVLPACLFTSPASPSTCITPVFYCLYIKAASSFPSMLTIVFGVNKQLFNFCPFDLLWTLVWPDHLRGQKTVVSPQ